VCSGGEPYTYYSLAPCFPSLLQLCLHPKSLNRPSAASRAACCTLLGCFRLQCDKFSVDFFLFLRALYHFARCRDTSDPADDPEGLFSSSTSCVPLLLYPCSRHAFSFANIRQMQRPWADETRAQLHPQMQVRLLRLPHSLPKVVRSLHFKADRSQLLGLGHRAPPPVSVSLER
jgi:hypothetical protein